MVVCICCPPPVDSIVVIGWEFELGGSMHSQPPLTTTDSSLALVATAMAAVMRMLKLSSLVKMFFFNSLMVLTRRT